MPTNFNVSLPDDVAREVIEKSSAKGITPTHYLEMLITSIIFKNNVSLEFFTTAAQAVKEEAESLAKNSPLGFQFVLNDLSFFKEIKNTVDLNGHTAPSTIKARIGRNFNKSVADGGIAGVKRAYKNDTDLKFLNGAAVYEIC